MSQHLQEYLEYIRNAGGSPTIEQFDDDWDPIGLMVRRKMKDLNMIIEKDGKVLETPLKPFPPGDGEK